MTAAYNGCGRCWTGVWLRTELTRPAAVPPHMNGIEVSSNQLILNEASDQALGSASIGDVNGDSRENETAGVRR